MTGAPTTHTIELPADVSSFARAAADMLALQLPTMGKHRLVELVGLLLTTDEQAAENAKRDEEES